MKVKITRDDMMKISLFEKMTGADVVDCISDDERIVFIVKEGDVGAAIGKGGENVKTAMEKFGKKIDIILNTICIGLEVSESKSGNIPPTKPKAKTIKDSVALIIEAE